MAYIDTSYIDAFLGPEVRQELFTDNGTYDSTRVDTVIEAADDRVFQQLKTAGYTPPPVASGTSDGMIKQASLGQFILMAYKRPTKSLDIPPDLRQYVDVLGAIFEGRIIPTTLKASRIGAVGGVKINETDPDVSGSRAALFRREDLADY